MKKLLLTTLAVFALSLQMSCADSGYSATKSVAESTPRKLHSTSSTYKSALKAAKSEQKKAKKVGMEWKTIGGKKGLLAKAKKLHKKGNDKAAIKLLEIAKTHAILGQKQAVDQVNAGPNF